MRRAFPAFACAALLLSGGWAFAQDSGGGPAELAAARRQADEARRQSDRLTARAAAARGKAEGARAQAAPRKPVP